MSSASRTRGAKSFAKIANRREPRDVSGDCLRSRSPLLCKMLNPPVCQVSVTPSVKAMPPHGLLGFPSRPPLGITLRLNTPSLLPAARRPTFIQVTSTAQSTPRVSCFALLMGVWVVLGMAAVATRISARAATEDRLPAWGGRRASSFPRGVAVPSSVVVLVHPQRSLQNIL